MQKSPLITIIDNIQSINREDAELQRNKGGDFNIFTILRKENDEVNLHSKFIYELIRHDETHGQRNLFLKLFLLHVLKIDIQDEKILVRREDYTEEKKRIDFVIETSNYLIGIEMKIDAKDQKDQLSDYYKELEIRQKQKKKKNIKLFYLTKFGHEPSKDSTKDLHKKFIELISFEYQIEEWLSACIQNVENIPKLKELLIQYLTLVQHLTGQLSKSKEKKMDELIIDKTNIDAIHQLVQHYPHIWAKKELEFWEKLCKKIQKINIYKENNFELEFLEQNDVGLNIDLIKEIRHTRKKDAFGFKIKKKFEIFKVEIEINHWNYRENIDIFISILGLRGKKLKNDGLKNLLENELKFKDESIDKKFYNKILIPKIKFYSKDTPNPTHALFDDVEFNSYIEYASKEVQNILKFLINNENALNNIVK